jgi:2-polyprenyl-3-methyl-5-hydroxy-6-metoxy-1,4-benzoquinol methylase
MNEVEKTYMCKKYRDRIYEKYATGFQDAPERFEVIAAERWGKAYDYYLRGWLPQNRQAQILDVACGRGQLLHFFIRQGYRSIGGVDISSEQVQLAKQVTPEVVEGDSITFLEARHEKFDLIAGLDIIEHFHKPEVLRFLDAASAALKPGGRIILQTPNAESPWGTMHRYNDFTHEVCFNPNALTRLMRLTGFTEIEPREMGPVPLGYSLASTVRYAVWRAIRAGLKIWNLAETGDTGSGVFTRVFLISGVKM